MLGTLNVNNIDRKFKHNICRPPYAAYPKQVGLNMKKELGELFPNIHQGSG